MRGSKGGKIGGRNGGGTVGQWCDKTGHRYAVYRGNELGCFYTLCVTRFGSEVDGVCSGPRRIRWTKLHINSETVFPKFEHHPFPPTGGHRSNARRLDPPGVRTGPGAAPDRGAARPNEINHLGSRDAGITLRRSLISSRSRPARVSNPIGRSAGSSPGLRACLPNTPCASSTALAADTRA